VAQLLFYQICDLGDGYGAKPKLAIEYGMSFSCLSSNDESISEKLLTWSFVETKVESKRQKNRVNVLVVILIV
jgi:hypothetical protein